MRMTIFRVSDKDEEMTVEEQEIEWPKKTKGNYRVVQLDEEEVEDSSSRQAQSNPDNAAE